MSTFRPVLWLGIGIAVLVSGHLFGLWAHEVYGWDRTGGVLRHLDLNDESNVAAWFESLMLFVCAVVAGLVAGASRLQQGPQTRRWVIVAFLLLLMAVDEASQLHDITTGPMRRQIGVDMEAGGALFFAWIIPAGLLALSAALYLLPLLFSLPRLVQLRLVAAGLVYFGGAVGIEAVSGYVVTQGRDSTPYHLVTTVEETFELLGGLLLFSTLLAVLGRMTPHLIFHFGGQTVAVTASPGSGTGEQDEDGGRHAADRGTFR